MFNLLDVFQKYGHGVK